MADIDPLSEIIGTLRAEVQENQRQHKASFRKLDAISEQITKLTGAVESLSLSLDATNVEMQRVKDDIDENVKPTVDDYKAMKNKGLGVIAFIGLLSSGSSLALFKWFTS